MTATGLPPIYDILLDYLVEKVSPQGILAFEVTEAVEKHSRDLKGRNDAGTLTPDEKVELEQILYIEQVIAALKARAQAALSK